MRQRPAVLILAFNRPGAATQLVNALSEVQPPLIYVAVDGARADVPADEERCQRVRDILTSLPWKTEVRTLFRDSNLGCGPAVAGGIDWFFSHEEEGIILEDDVLPHPTMFPFMAELLERYRNEERVMHISASNYAGALARHSYFFSLYVSIWGWASWRRAWRYFNLDLSDWRVGPDVLHRPGLSWRTRRYLAFAFDRAAEGLSNWDYQWKYAVMRHGVAVTPRANLAVTTSFGEEATGLRHEAEIPPLQPISGDLDHPAVFALNADLDSQLFAEQLKRGAWYWEASRLLVPSPRLYHRIGRTGREVLRLVRPRVR